ncbi:MAG TPA: class I SAM-dependent methyltransferase [Desulfobacterales bacterium]|nr:class I SAM-dependent methyltransferase [Desulfobacterales bacterium]
MSSLDSKNGKAEIQVVPGKEESISFEDATFDAVSASSVLCSVTSPQKSLEEFKRMLWPGGQVCLLEHVRSVHWLKDPVYDTMKIIENFINSEKSYDKKN